MDLLTSTRAALSGRGASEFSWCSEVNASAEDFQTGNPS